MKAKEYAEKLNADPTMSTLAEIGTAFIREVSNLIEARGCKTDDAIISVFDELDLKWKAFAKRSQHINIRSDGFTVLIKTEFPTMFDSWRKLRPNKTLTKD